MPRFVYPPHDFKCLYRHCCPYLDGLSTQWVLEEYRRAGEVYQEHLRIIDSVDGNLKARDERIRVLERENAELKARFQALHQRQFKSNKKKSIETGGKEVENVSSSMEKEKKKRGPPVGHPGWVRPKPDRIDRTVEVPAPTFCPHCQSNDLTPMEEKTEHVQEDIVIRPQTVVTCYRHGQAFCARCNRPVVQAGESELLNAPIGPVAKSVAIYLRYRIGIPYRKTTELFRELFGLKFVPASALGFDRKAAAQGAPIYQDLRDKIRASDVVHADETSWRGDGVGPEISLYLPPASRRTTHQQSRGTVSQTFGDLSQDMLRNEVRDGTQNPQHPSQSGANRQKTRRPSQGVPPNPPHRRYGNRSSRPV